MAEQTNERRELTQPTEYIELPRVTVNEHLLALFSNKVQRDYIVSDFAVMDGNVVVKLKRRGQMK
jgi:hypothetical protein